MNALVTYDSPPINLVDAIGHGIEKYGRFALSDKEWLILLFGNAQTSAAKLHRLQFFARQHGWSVKMHRHGNLAVFRRESEPQVA
jgi:hypothetical protein